MNKDRTLILVETDPSSIFTSDLKENGYNVDLFFKEVNVVFRAIRRLWLKYNLPFSNIWFDRWFNELNKYDCIIINVNRLNHKLFNYITNKNNNIKIIGWYWNTVDDTNYPIDYKDNIIEYWSFDDNDCKKYGFKKNIQYYSAPKEISNRKEYDIYFVGREKGRKEEIENFKRIAKSYGLKCNFNIADNNIIPYSEVKKDLAKSKAVLEINKEKQVGFTLRTLESLFYGIKLITNNKEIENSELYNKQNIFIIGKDDDKELYQFINNEYNHGVDYLKENYTIDTWFNNFFKENL